MFTCSKMADSNIKKFWSNRNYSKQPAFDFLFHAALQSVNHGVNIKAVDHWLHVYPSKKHETVP